MPEIASFTVNDGAATPVARTFVPAHQSGNAIEFREKTNGIPAGDWVLSIDYQRPTSSTAAHRFKVGLNMPRVATVDGSLQVVRNDSAQVTFNLSQVGTTLERKHLLAILSGVIGNDPLWEAVENVETFY